MHIAFLNNRHFHKAALQKSGFRSQMNKPEATMARKEKGGGGPTQTKEGEILERNWTPKVTPQSSG